MKYIIIVIPTLRMGGAEKALVSLLKSLDSERVNVDLFLFEPGGILQKDIPAWVNIIESDTIVRDMTLEIRNYFGELIRRKNFLAALARLKITFQAKLGLSAFSWDTIKNFIPNVEGYYDVAIGFLEGFADFFVVDKVDADKKIGWIHTDMTGRIINLQEKAYYQRFDTLATISETCKKAFVEAFSYDRTKIWTIENIVLPQDILLKAEEKTDINWDFSKKNIVSVGRLEYPKGFDIGARAAKVLKDKGYNFCWHIYGDGLMRGEIQKYIKENSLEDNYILEGLKVNPYPYMKKADIVVQPSRWEGKSLVLDEAKILGKAIVTTGYPSVRDQIIDGKTGIITDIVPESIAKGIEILIQDKTIKSELELNCTREPNRNYQVIKQFYKMIGV